MTAYYKELIKGYFDKHSLVESNVQSFNKFMDEELQKIVNETQEIIPTIIPAEIKDFKIKLPDEIIKEWVDLMVRNSMIVEPKEKIEAVKDDIKDNIFIEIAIAGKVDYIVSQDNHLLKLKGFRGIKIITPEEFNKLCN